MTKKEIIEAIENGGKLEVSHFIKNIKYYLHYENETIRITQKQYNSAKEHFGNKLQHNTFFGILTRHFYFLKK